LKDLGVDLVDCSSGGNVEKADIPLGPAIRRRSPRASRADAGIATAAVGMITRARQATTSSAPVRRTSCCSARELLARALLAAARRERTRRDQSWPAQYLRAAPRGANGADAGARGRLTSNRPNVQATEVSCRSRRLAISCAARPAEIEPCICVQPCSRT